MDGLSATLEPASPETVVIRLAGILDLATREQMTAAVRAALPAFRPDALILDLDAVTLLDSAGLGALVGCWKLAAGAGCALRVRNPRPLAHAQLEMTGLAELFL
ncbi:STAS domain-containing protein [Dactylosporangium matsuzakiense]|uniref:Anti-sigma factor antagonist n=1 Tax=Dactylosporangium matsuzakiense TaxID=53360 RepID=A0A9W6NL17_9ACTN|nr:STAS domain-containing protein [Dactylosporangium matsuzakiense]UWZ45565.1 STAS domain-containing protein [Dactylosporangium matsuzakiense]GLL00432.1 anti-sigma factor antagonist [Dactylosporangium matsuzakiense]